MRGSFHNPCFLLDPKYQICDVCLLLNAKYQIWDGSFREKKPTQEKRSLAPLAIENIKRRTEKYSKRTSKTKSHTISTVFIKQELLDLEN